MKPSLLAALLSVAIGNTVVVAQQPQFVMPAPAVTARTNRASKQIQISQTGSTRVEQDNRSESVSVSVRFFSKPPVPYQVQCFFISKNESTLARTIYDADSHTSQDSVSEGQFSSAPLAGGRRTFTSIPISGSYTNSDGSTGTVTGSVSSSSATRGNRIEGWIVRVVAQGHVLRIESNQPTLAEFAATIADQLDAAAAKIPPGKK